MPRLYSFYWASAYCLRWSISDIIRRTDRGSRYDNVDALRPDGNDVSGIVNGRVCTINAFTFIQLAVLDWKVSALVSHSRLSVPYVASPNCDSRAMLQQYLEDERGRLRERINRTEFQSTWPLIGQPNVGYRHPLYSAGNSLSDYKRFRSEICDSFLSSLMHLIKYIHGIRDAPRIRLAALRW